MEKVEDMKRSRYLNCFFPELSLCKGLACLCVRSGKQLGCNEADAVKGCVSTPDSCAWKQASAAYVCSSALSRRLVTTQHEAWDVSLW